MPIVGIGASAGGLEVLQDFFSHAPPDSGMAFVVVSHQQPDRRSLLPELLGKTTSMPVQLAQNGMPVEPNHVYVAPVGLLGIARGTLVHTESRDEDARFRPIDNFFRALAADQHEYGICVVLSGAGTDGTLGLRAIKAEGGMAMVQTPINAQYASMPSSAVSTGLADYVLPASEMPGALVAYARGPYLATRAPAAERPGIAEEPLVRILVQLRAHTGHDFTTYKRSTVSRRIERRMSVHRLDDPEAYVRYVRENPHELDLLFRELLISVTSFFRDREAFDALAKNTLPDLLAARADDHILRVWVPGCATGEEAYSVAILLNEQLRSAERRMDVQVFATDLDDLAVESARRGVYPADIVGEVSRERLGRYFLRESGHYRVRKEIRQSVIFATQNLIKDPPFTNLDLIACRNVLIYLEAEVQRRLLLNFHYALRPSGCLFLGPSESLGEASKMFLTVDGKWKIFRRKETATPLHPVMEPRLKAANHAAEYALAPVADPQPLRSRAAAHAQKLLLARYVPSTAVVDDQGRIIFIHGRTGHYLEPAEGQPTNNILDMAREGLATALGIAIRQARVKSKEVIRLNVQVRANGGFIKVDFTVTPITEPESLRGLLLISFRSAEEPAAAPLPVATPSRLSSGPEESLERELQYVRESLQSTIEELETANEELKASNEELQSTNEELQSTNEELETSKEEMQSLNEELNTVNAELQSKVDAFARTNDDMQNLLNSTQVATIFLDAKLNVQRFTERAKELVSFIATDVGRPLSDLASALQFRNLAADCQEVLRDLVPVEREICGDDGRWHLLRIMPYRTSENLIDGVVLTIFDIGHQKRMEFDATRDCFECLTGIVREPVVVLDDEGNVVLANDGFLREFGLQREEVVGRALHTLGPGWDTAPWRDVRFGASLVDGEASDQQFEYSSEEARRVFLLNARRLTYRIGQTPLIMMSFLDVAEPES